MNTYVGVTATSAITGTTHLILCAVGKINHRAVCYIVWSCPVFVFIDVQLTTTMSNVASIPADIWSLILPLACTDGGRMRTGKSLALTSSFFYVQAYHFRFYSLAFDKLVQIESFLAYARRQPSDICFLQMRFRLLFSRRGPSVVLQSPILPHSPSRFYHFNPFVLSAPSASHKSPKPFPEPLPRDAQAQ